MRRRALWHFMRRRAYVEGSELKSRGATRMYHSVYRYQYESCEPRNYAFSETILRLTV
jgi:hypothetical protein